MRARMVVCWRAASFFAAARRESGISTVVFIHITIHGDPFRCKTGLFRSSENERVAPGKERYSDGSLADGGKAAEAGANRSIRKDASRWRGRGGGSARWRGGCCGVFRPVW